MKPPVRLFVKNRIRVGQMKVIVLVTGVIVDEARPPVSTIMDEMHKIAIPRLGDRVRVGRMTVLAGFDLNLRTKRR